MSVIDCHTHIFAPEITRDRNKIALLDSQFATVYNNPKAKMAEAGALGTYMTGEKVDRAVACGFPFRDNGIIRLMNDYILDARRSDERIIPFVMVNLDDESEALAEAERCRLKGARGIGEIAFYEDGFGEKERRSIEGIGRYAEDSGMIVMFHVNEQIGHEYKGKALVDFAEVVRFVESHPGLDIILAHLGGGLCFYEFMPEIADAFARVRYDLSAAPLLYSAPIYAFLAQHLARKTLFGSDFPLLSLKRYLPGLTGIDPQTRDEMLGGNAMDLFGPQSEVSAGQPNPSETPAQPY